MSESPGLPQALPSLSVQRKRNQKDIRNFSKQPPILNFCLVIHGESRQEALRKVSGNYWGNRLQIQIQKSVYGWPDRHTRLKYRDDRRGKESVDEIADELRIDFRLTAEGLQKYGCAQEVKGVFEKCPRQYWLCTTMIISCLPSIEYLGLLSAVGSSSCSGWPTENSYSRLHYSIIAFSFPPVSCAIWPWAMPRFLWKWQAISWGRHCLTWWASRWS